MDAVWLYTVASVLIVSLISLVGVVTLVLNAERLQRVLFYFVSFSAGALLGDVFLHLLPEIMAGDMASEAGAYILTGIVLFFLLERALVWNHGHGVHREEVHATPYITIVGDALHNFIDGIAIAASFLISVPVGLATVTAVIFHEIPQEIGQFAILIHGGWSKRKALLYNFLSALTAIVGALLVLVFSEQFSEAPTLVLGIGAAGFIYIALSDLLPELQKESNMRRSALQLFWMIVGMAVMAALLLLET
jgi:zinc and cadmium transporter